MKSISLLSEKFEAPEFQKWVSNCKVTDKRFFLDNNIDLELFVHIGKFIFPNFIEVKGLIFIEELVDPALINPSSSHLSLEEYQASFNRLSLAIYFNQSASCSNDLWNAALEITKVGWLHSLKKLYPNIEFVVQTSHEEAYDPYILFYQKQA
ncbi:MAG: hypothetical protein VX447_10830 [Pseudomonadota bacterium]|uniref:hypothetical protein n=1 Tax=Gallaecimonas pentaromativorans TaxID=584787 RepID=UPI00067F5545|nr:hypothetical protein [Gallaecimonas pentaromativorans]MED5525229.1 hypothetical protein [Pseudomonadota bacterium]